MTSIDRPAICSPVVVFLTRTAVVPGTKPAGSLTVRRFCVASIDRTVIAGALTAAPDAGTKLTVFLLAVASKPVPTIVNVTPADANAGPTDASDPPAVGLMRTVASRIGNTTAVMLLSDRETDLASTLIR